jgi:hypothetical protein
MDNALIAGLSLIYIFSDQVTVWNSSNADKVKLLINYRVASSYTVSDKTFDWWTDLLVCL